MESKRTVPSGSPTAPPLHYYSSHPPNYPPPPQYGTPGTGLPPQYGTPGTGPPPQYGTQGTEPPPQYGIQGAGPPPQYGIQGTGTPLQYGIFIEGTGPPPPPQYDVQGTGPPPQVPPPQYGMQSTGPLPHVPPPQYGMQSTGPPPQVPPPQYGMQGTGPYEPVSPPPPYSVAPPVTYNQGYPVTGIPGTQPLMQPGQSLYPDLSRLPGPPGAPVMYGTSNPLAPARPAPLPPNQTATPLPATRPGSQKCSFAHLKEGQTPQGYVVQWRGGDGLQIFFLQQEGHIVSPKKPLIMSIYKQICVSGSVEGMVEVHGVWRLRLAGKNTPALHVMPDCYTFLDNSTCPSRMVVVQMSSQVTKKMSADLLDLLTQLTDLRSEEGGVVDKVTSGVATVYGDLTQKLNTAVKGTVPSAHKSTKWLRKSAGSMVKIGGNLVAKGMHLVADHIPVNDKPQEESAVHTELLTALRRYRKALEENTVSYIE